MLQELLSGIRVIKAFATEKQETGRFNKENARIININFRQSCVSELSSPVMELIGAIGIGLVIWYGGREVIQGDMTPGTFFAFMGALAMLYTPFKSLNGANMNVQNALPGPSACSPSSTILPSRPNAEARCRRTSLSAS